MRHDLTSIESQALDWVIRLRDPAFDAWEAFEAWLSDDPAHADAYHAIAVDDLDMAAMLAAAPRRRAALPAMRFAIGRRHWIGGALAASIVALIGLGYVNLRPIPYLVETGPGVRQVVALSDGTRIALNGGTRLMLDRNDDRVASLERGEALFAVVHDESNPFRVMVGETTLVDVGTRFNVVRTAGETRVAVSEGAVMYNPDSDAIRIDVGRSLRARDGDSRLLIGYVAPASVAAWRSARLVYDGQSLAEVAGDLARYYGHPVTVDPRLAGRPFHGVLSLDADGDLARLAPLLEVRITRKGAGWAFSAP